MSEVGVEMAESVSKELILPALRLDVPARPSERQLSALAERSAEEWTTTPREWTTRLVTRLAVAEVLRSRLAQAAQRADRSQLPDDPEQVTLAQLVALFRPHVGLAGQAFQLAVVEAVNSGVPAVADPLREGLKRVGVTGRDPLRMMALGLEKVPARARQEFWDGARGSATLTAVVDAVAGGWHDSAQARPRDVSGLDRSQLARADALVMAGGRTTPITIGSGGSVGARGAEGGRSWLQVPVQVTRRGRGTSADEHRRNELDKVVEVALRADSWVEVFETALEAVGASMQQIDLGSRPRGGRQHSLAEVITQRLVAAKERTVAEVCASLRAIDPFALEMFDHQVTTVAVPVAVPVVDDDRVVQLWLPTSALAGPLFTGAPDLFMGDGADVKAYGGRPPGKPGAKSGAKSDTRSGARTGARQGRKPGGRPGQKPDGATGETASETSGERSAGRQRRPRGGGRRLTEGPRPDGADAPADQQSPVSDDAPKAPAEPPVESATELSREPRAEPPVQAPPPSIETPVVLPPSE